MKKKALLHFLQGTPVLRYMLALALAAAPALVSAQTPMTLNLNGEWEMGLNRNYTQKVKVPGIHQNPAEITQGRLWYRRKVTLPAGKYGAASLTLNGARFRPQFYINGKLVDSAQGGMAPVTFAFTHKELKPGKSLTLEIALQPLNAVPSTDASCIPPADRWRSNVSSGLWDDVSLRLHNPHFITRVVPHTDMLRKQVTVQVYLSRLAEKPLPANSQVRAELLDAAGNSVVESFGIAVANVVPVTLGSRNLKTWSPEEPNQYRLVVEVLDPANKAIDRVSMPFGLKEFRTLNKGLVLNNKPFVARAGTIVWHRWVRDKEARELAYDTTWLLNNVVKPLKARGANTLRFHLGTPPEALLRLCDRHGLAVQYEWLFFHGLPASRASLENQWQSWLDLGVKHPSTCIIHPWNETEQEGELATGRDALAALLPQYPDLVLADRNTLHLHKYWWSLFENLGLYYNSFNDFPLPVIADEFGGNYLDGNGDPGGYKTLSEAFLRFLGKGHTAEQRLEHHTLANGRVAEYWRRLGVAGFSPFCIAGSWEDGNHWYSGPLKDGKLKPVWDAMTAAWAPSTVSIDLWDRNVVPGGPLRFPLWLINGDDQVVSMKARLRVVDAAGKTSYDTLITAQVKAFSRNKTYPRVRIPNQPGDYMVQAELLEPKQGVQLPIISQWKVTAFAPSVPAPVQGLTVGVDDQESELLLFADRHKFKVVKPTDPTARIVLVGRRTYSKLAAGDATTRKELEAAVAAGRHLVFVAAGPQWLGQAEKSHYQGSPKVADPQVEELSLFGGLGIQFREMPEPESHVHAAEGAKEMYANLQPRQTWLWNGQRGGLIVPAADMFITGLSQDGLRNLWRSRGADEPALNAMTQGGLYAYELQGYYEFSQQEGDKAAQQKLRERVRFAVQDGPALKASINPEAPITAHNLGQAWQQAGNSQVRAIKPMVVAGKNLTRTPVVALDYGQKGGRIILSQLMMNGRLVPEYTDGNHYGQRYDPAADQLLLNMLATALMGKGE